MKMVYALSMVLALAITVTGCCSMCKSYRKGGDKCPSCGAMSKEVCPQCGMQKGQCKCPAPASPTTTEHPASE